MISGIYLLSRGALMDRCQYLFSLFLQGISVFPISIAAAAAAARMLRVPDDAAQKRIINNKEWTRAYYRRQI